MTPGLVSVLLTGFLSKHRSKFQRPLDSDIYLDGGLDVVLKHYSCRLHQEAEAETQGGRP